MPILVLNEEDVRRVLTIEMAIEAVEEGLRRVTLDEATNSPRVRCQTDHAMMHVMSASAKTLGVMGYKAYSTSKQGPNFHVCIFDGKTGALAALMQADYLGQCRTGAASAVAAKYMSRPESARVGLFGAGKQARTQLLALSRVRKLTHVQVYSRNEDNRRKFCEEMTHLCHCPVEPASRPEDAARNKDVVITATTSHDPVLEGSWIAEGTHLNITGSNFLMKAEIDVTTIRRSKIIVVDNKEQAHREAGDFRAALDDGTLQWSNVRELGAVIVGRTPGRASPTDITLFKSLGLAIEDVATAPRLITAAKEQNIGRWIDW